MKEYLLNTNLDLLVILNIESYVLSLNLGSPGWKVNANQLSQSVITY